MKKIGSVKFTNPSARPRDLRGKWCVRDFRRV